MNLISFSKKNRENRNNKFPFYSNYIINTKYFLVLFRNINNSINKNCLEIWIVIFLILSFIYTFSRYIYNKLSISFIYRLYHCK